MERTTQELMDALLSKRDVEDYLRENAGELLSQTLHLKLHVMDSDSYEVLTDRTVEVKLA